MAEQQGQWRAHTLGRDACCGEEGCPGALRSEKKGGVVVIEEVEEERGREPLGCR